MVCFSVFMLYVSWKSGLPRKFARFALFRPVKKRSFNLLSVLDFFSSSECWQSTLFQNFFLSMNHKTVDDFGRYARRARAARKTSHRVDKLTRRRSNGARLFTASLTYFCVVLCEFTNRSTFTLLDNRTADCVRDGYVTVFSQVRQQCVDSWMCQLFLCCFHGTMIVTIAWMFVLVRTFLPFILDRNRPGHKCFR